MMRHFGMTPRTTEVGAKEQNGDVEAANGAFKRRLEQALLVRGSRDFESATPGRPSSTRSSARPTRAVGRASPRRSPRCARSTWAAPRVPRRHGAQVSEWSTIRVQHCSYSVPARLIGEALRVHLYEDRLEAYFGEQARALVRAAARAQRQHRIDYRHVIWSLVRASPAASRATSTARRCSRRSCSGGPTTRSRRPPRHRRRPRVPADPHLAASTMQADVEAALTLLLAEGVRSPATGSRRSGSGSRRPTMPEMRAPTVDLHDYDLLLGEVAA
jgi:hypothetical protein